MSRIGLGNCGIVKSRGFVINDPRKDLIEGFQELLPLLERNLIVILGIAALYVCEGTVLEEYISF